MGARDKSSKAKKKSKHNRHSKSSRKADTSSDSSEGDIQQQLKRERAAVGLLRGILIEHQSVRADLRGLLWSLDQGKAVSIAGIQDVPLKERVRQLFRRLRLQYDDAKGIYGKSASSPPILSILGFVFDEPMAKLLAAHKPTLPSATSSLPSADASAPPNGSAKQPAGIDVQSAKVGASSPAPRAAALRTPAAVGSLRGTDANDGGSSSPSTSGSPPTAAPAAQPTTTATTQAGALAPVARRAVGPAMPPPEVLAAAAAAAEEQRQQEEQEAEEERERDEASALVGPPPPELVEEMDAMPANERDAEVVRIMRALREATLQDAKAAPPGAPPPAPGFVDAGADAYVVLGVEPSAAAAEVKKRYMRLSLLIHPDKCKHPSAHEAFQALSRAAKLLQDSDQRAALNARRDDVELRKLAAAEAKRQERERLWRVAKGEEPAGPAYGAKQQRESWMMDLPPERVAPTSMQQVNVRAFSRTGPRIRGDTSEWTDTPAMRAAKEAQGLLQGAAMEHLLALTGSAASEAGIGPGGRPPAVSANILDSYEARARPKTLMEKHQESLAAAQKRPRKSAPQAPLDGAATLGGQGQDTSRRASAAAAATAPESPSSSSSGESRGEGGVSGGDSDAAEGRERKKRKRRHKKEKGDGGGGSSSKREKKSHKAKREPEQRGEGRPKKSSSAAQPAAAGAAAGAGSGGAGGAEVPDWVGKHPWKPFDRDKDLEIKPAGKTPREMMNAAGGGLGGMFSSGGTQRHFL